IANASAIAVRSTSAAIASAMSSYRDLRGLIARVGVAAFSISLLLPTLVHANVSQPVIVASSVDRPALTFVEERIALPNVRPAPVVDRGPYVAGRELDLSPRVKAALGCTDLCTVVMHIP